MADSMRRKQGINLLIALYFFLGSRQLLGLTASVAEIIFSLIFVGTLAFMIFGFVKRISISRVIAIVFHVVWHIGFLSRFLSMCNTESIQQEIEGITPGEITLTKSLFAVGFIVVTAINIVATRYLIRNKDYFSKTSDETTQTSREDRGRGLVDNKKKAWWVKAVILIGIVAIIFFGAKGIIIWRQLPVVKEHLLSKVTVRVSEAEMSGDFAPDQISALKEIVALQKQKEPSFADLQLLMAPRLALEDGEISGQEEEVLYLIRDFLREKEGRGSVIDFLKFGLDNPQIDEFYKKKRAERSNR